MPGDLRGWLPNLGYLYTPSLGYLEHVLYATAQKKGIVFECMYVPMFVCEPKHFGKYWFVGFVLITPVLVSKIQYGGSKQINLQKKVNWIKTESFLMKEMSMDWWQEINFFFCSQVLVILVLLRASYINRCKKTWSLNLNLPCQRLQRRYYQESAAYLLSLWFYSGSHSLRNHPKSNNA